MHTVDILSPSEQVAAHLLERIQSGIWPGGMPGVMSLEGELGVNRTTVEAALQLLEAKGVLVGQGPGRARRIALPEEMSKPSGLRVAFLLYEKINRDLDYVIDCKSKLEAAGHTVFYALGSLTEIKMDVRRLARMVEKTEADAWVVGSGTSDVLQWFMQQKIPVFALFGRRRKLKIAAIGPDNIAALAEATRRLMDLGHQRIVLLDSIYSASDAGIFGSAVLDELSAGGIIVGSYNMPGWEGGLEGLYAFLDSSFQHTPPTALIASSSPIYFATLHFLLNRGIRVPQDLSLVCTDDDPHFSQCRPSISYVSWSSRPVANRIVRWVRNISQGKEDTRQTTIKAEFIEGGTIGPAPEG